MQIRYNKAIKDRIISLLDEEANYTISDICAIIGISRKTFYKWKKNIPEFTEELEESINRNRDAMMESVQTAIRKKLEGYQTTEVRTKYIQDENGEWIAKEKIVIEKECPPDLRTIKMMLDRCPPPHIDDTEKTPSLQIIVPDEKDAIDVENFYYNLTEKERSTTNPPVKISLQTKRTCHRKEKMECRTE